MNIFETLPVNFFNIFNNANRSVFSDCLFVLYDYMKDDAAFASLKENIIFELTKYFNTHIIEFDDVQNQTSKERAFYVYRRLKDCGWINEEVGDNYQVYASFEDYAMTIIEVLFNLDKDKDIEYSSMVYNIYSSFTNFDITNGNKILDAQYSMTKELMSKLKNLNTNIKRYIKKLLRDNMKNDLNQLLESLLSEYQLKIVDRAFYNLTTRDHPVKYRNNIIDTINKIRDNDEMTDTIVRSIMDSKDKSYQEAYSIFSEQTLYIIEAFEGILDLITEISKKNENFVASATNKIMFLINVKEDIGGKINEIIKEGQKYDGVLDNIIDISMHKGLDQASLYSPRELKKAMKTDLIDEIELDDKVRMEAMKRIKSNDKYTKKAIEKRVLNSLEDVSELKGSKYFDEQNDISLFVLTWLYGYSESSKYKIEPVDKLVSTNHYQFREFTIKEK